MTSSDPKPNPGVFMEQTKKQENIQRTCKGLAVYFQ